MKTSIKVLKNFHSHLGKGKMILDTETHEYFYCCRTTTKIIPDIPLLPLPPPPPLPSPPPNIHSFIHSFILFVHITEFYGRMMDASLPVIFRTMRPIKLRGLNTFLAIIFWNFIFLLKCMNECICVYTLILSRERSMYVHICTYICIYLNLE